MNNLVYGRYNHVVKKVSSKRTIIASKFIGRKCDTQSSRTISRIIITPVFPVATNGQTRFARCFYAKKKAIMVNVRYYSV